MTEWIGSIQRSVDFVPAWVFWNAFLILAVAIALILQRIAFLTLERRLRGTERIPWLRLLRKVKGPSALAAVIVAVEFWLQISQADGEAPRILLRVLQVALIALFTWAAAVSVDIFGSAYLRQFRLDVDDNLLARKQVTQVRILKRATISVIAVIGIAAALMTFDSVKQYGVSLFASAGVAGLAIGLAARPLLSNLIAGVQIAMTQPIRIEDVVIVEGEYGTVEEITSTYVIVALWDWRRMVLPLNYFIEKPFQNWTREASSIIGNVTFNVDFATPIDRVRAALSEAVKESSRWDGRVVNLQVIDSTDTSIQLRALMSAKNAAASWDLRCEIREKLISFLQLEMPEALPRHRQVFESPSGSARSHMVLQRSNGKHQVS
jgi:small-conductance mechanosensitive channel